ncbi:jg4306 [Pararge aegeria aegeria]|uniref:Jg4306 protein n=1 Tax=Pararge aegeria aegeria TaxID=348720 RepID=A0A8S4QWW8_9NEOP|nr:jg4306 [Pararge aegeria aegeria]
MAYCSHLWYGSDKYQTEALDSVDRRTRRTIGNESLSQAELHSLQHRRNVACLADFTGYTLAILFRNLIILFLRHHFSTEQRDGGILMW